MKVFFCYSTSNDTEYVIQVAKHLRVSMEKVFYFEDPEQNRGNFIRTLNRELASHDVFVAFVGKSWTEWQEKELDSIAKRQPQPEAHAVFIGQTQEQQKRFIEAHSVITFNLILEVTTGDEKEAFDTACQILRRLKVPYRCLDDLPLDPHLFSYEKDIIDFFKKKASLGPDLHKDPGPEWGTGHDGTDPKPRSVSTGADKAGQESEVDREEFRKKEREQRADMRKKLLDGAPSSWPKVQRWEEIIAEFQGKWKGIDRWRDTPYPSSLEDVGEFRQAGNNVVAAALTTYHKPMCGGERSQQCMVEQSLVLPEAGPRAELYFPPLRSENTLNVAILVSGGIAPGINSVIDGIVQRHWLYARKHKQWRGLTIFGLQNGFRAFEAFQKSYVELVSDHERKLGDRELVTSDHANEGGSMLGTSRVDELIDLDTRMAKLEFIVNVLRRNQIDILYVIGGDGSMKAAHAIWSMARNMPERPISVVTIPKTMDNDVLWVWQAFGFLSAVEKAREVIEHLHTEVKSNPRLCVVQLFGSDSGFVVSHSVLASATGHCDVALIPEVPFSMTKLAKILKEKMCRKKQRIPYGLVVMAETAIPTDATNYAAPLNEKPKIDIDLSRSEQDAILKFHELREAGKRIQGQTSHVLRAAGLKIVTKGLPKLLHQAQLDEDLGFEPEWGKMRVVVNEPRHLLRAISPSCLDIIFGQRLGVLAVDNAMAGYTDFMISQWLTEYVVVPLKLVVLGRKRIPSTGIFWKSLLSKTNQPEDMVNSANKALHADGL